MIATTSTELKVMNCPECAGSFAILQAYYENARIVGHFKHTWNCPYCGTSRGFGESSHEQEKKRLNALLESTQRSEKYLRTSRDNALLEDEHFRRSRDGVKGALAKQKKRISHGVCICCNRTFQNLKRHMETQHPEMAKEEKQ